MPNETPQPLVNPTPQPLVKPTPPPPSAVAPAVDVSSASTSRPPPSLETPDSADSQSVHILEDAEQQAVELTSTTSISQHRYKRKRRKEDEEEDRWMQDVMLNLQTNQALLERLLDEREGGRSEREPFVRYVSDTLRTVTDDQFNTIKDLVLDIFKQVKVGQ